MRDLEGERPPCVVSKTGNLNFASRPAARPPCTAGNRLSEAVILACVHTQRIERPGFPREHRQTVGTPLFPARPTAPPHASDTHGKATQRPPVSARRRTSTIPAPSQRGRGQLCRAQRRGGKSYVRRKAWHEYPNRKGAKDAKRRTKNNNPTSLILRETDKYPRRIGVGGGVLTDEVSAIVDDVFRF